MDPSDKSHEMLVMWMELQRALGEFSRQSNAPYASVLPWECNDERVREAWEKLTRPTNLEQLEEWLRAADANGQNVVLAEAAVQRSRERRTEE